MPATCGQATKQAAKIHFVAFDRLISMKNIVHCDL